MGQSPSRRYRGRFAPSPTGPLHFGSLTTAVGSYLSARHARGEWHVRIDDLDRPRIVPGAADAILRTLEAFGFQWDGPVCYQSQRTEAYAAALSELRRRGAVYECSCSRRELQALARHHGTGDEADEIRYPGLCRTGPLAPERNLAVRFRVPSGPVAFDDQLQGHVVTDVEAESGDFVVRRRDGLFAYQLACVVDDHDQGFTHIVRGADLLGSTARQILLQRTLAYPQPTYAHLPVMVDAAGRKLSKSSAAPAVDPSRASAVLWQAFQYLQLAPPAPLRTAPTRDLWSWALEHWGTAALRGQRTVVVQSETHY